MSRDKFLPAPRARIRLKLKALKEPPVKNWSLSRLNEWQECPLRYRLSNVEKFRMPDAPVDDPNDITTPLGRGSHIHKLAELFVKNGGKLPPELANFRKEFIRLRTRYKERLASPECEIALDKDWRSVDWFSQDAWLRIKADAIVFPPLEEAGEKPVLIIDYKTGKIRGEYVETLELYGMGAVAAELGVGAVGQLWFIDHRAKIPEALPKTSKAGKHCVRKEDMPKLRAKWERRVAPMLADTIFPARPNQSCAWCPFAARKGGPCDY